MNIPLDSSQFVDTIKTEFYIALLLCDEPRLRTLPILPEVKMLSESDLTVDALVDSPRSSFSVTPTGVNINQAKENAGVVPVTGCGLLVEEPEAESDSPGVRGEITWKISIVSMEDRNKNYTPKVGTGIPGSVALQIVKDALHQQQIYGIGCLILAKNWFTTAHDWETMKPGYKCNRLTMTATTGTAQSKRTPGCQAVFSGPPGSQNQNCTLNFADPDDPQAVLIYTLDRTPPVQANPTAQLYQGPFQVNSGDVVVASARSSTKVLSEIFGFTAP